MTCEMRELGVIELASPCRQKWSRMKGTEQVRFCARCERNVYNLSALTADEARGLFQAHEGRLCVRFWQRPDGTVLTRDCPNPLRRFARSRVPFWLAAFAALMALLCNWLRTGRRESRVGGADLSGYRDVWTPIRPAPSLRPRAP